MNWRFLGLVVGAASLLAWGASAQAAPVRAALLPIAVHSKDEGSAYLSAGLAEMISAFDLVALQEINRDLSSL